jgi:hypothetical protein
MRKQPQGARILKPLLRVFQVGADRILIRDYLTGLLRAIRRAGVGRSERFPAGWRRTGKLLEG